MANLSPKEEDEQKTLVAWLEIKGFKFTAIPNSTYTPSWKQKTKNYEMGLRPGLPDLLVILPDRGLVFIEMKRKKGSKVYPQQQEWITELNALDSIEAQICYGADQAIALLSNLML